MNNKVLALIFLILLGLIALGKMNSGKKQRSFDPNIVALDTAAITKVLISPKTDGVEVKLEKDAGNWTVSKNGKSYTATASAVKSLLAGLSTIKAQRVTAKRQEKWAEYELDDETKGRFQVFTANDKVADLMIGRFDFSQQARTATSFVRKVGEDEVYAVDGFLSASLSQDYNSYRDKAILKLDKNALESIVLQVDERTKTFQNNQGNWTDETGVAQDSTKMAGWINSLSNLNGSLTENLDASTLGSPHAKLTINTTGVSHTVKCYKREGEKPYKIHSSQNSEAWFESDENATYKSLFGIEI